MAQPRSLHYSDKRQRWSEPHGPVLNSEESRQGIISGRVFLILVTSLSLCLMALAVLLTVFA